MESLNKYYVYFYRRNDTNDVCYIGKGTGKRATKYTQHNEHCNRIKNKHGITVEMFKTNLSEDEASQLEKDLIYYFVEELGYGISISGYSKNMDGHNLCNQTLGGEGCFGCIPSEETRKKISESKMGEKNPSKREYVKEKLRKNHHMKNEMAKLAQSNAMKEFYASERGILHREQSSNEKKKFYQTEAWVVMRKNLSRKGTEWAKTDEGKAHLTKASKKAKEFWESPEGAAMRKACGEKVHNYYQSEEGKKKREGINKKISESNRKNSYTVSCIETGEMYECITHLAQSIGVSFDRIWGKFRRSKDGIVEIEINGNKMHFVRNTKNSV